MGDEVYPDPQEVYCILKATGLAPPSKHRLLFSLICNTHRTQKRAKARSARLRSGQCWKEIVSRGMEKLQSSEDETQHEYIMGQTLYSSGSQQLHQKSSLNLSGAMRLKSVLPSCCHKMNISSPSEPPGATTSPGNRKNSGTAPDTMPSQKATTLRRKSSA